MIAILLVVFLVLTNGKGIRFSPPEKIVIPDVVGMNLFEAETVLRLENFEVMIKLVHGDVAPWVIVSATPRKVSLEHPGKQMNLVVSLGPDEESESNDSEVSGAEVVSTPE